MVFFCWILLNIQQTLQVSTQNQVIKTYKINIHIKNYILYYKYKNTLYIKNSRTRAGNNFNKNLKPSILLDMGVHSSTHLKYAVTLFANALIQLKENKF